MNYIFPTCKTSYKKSTLRIVNKIKQKNTKLKNSFNGWKNITDLLRAMILCTNA